MYMDSYFSTIDLILMQRRMTISSSSFSSMAFMVCFLVHVAFAFVNIVADAQQIQSNISRVSSLTPTTNSSWLSHSGLYAFGFYNQGNGYGVGIMLAGLPEKTLVWTANRDEPLLVSNNATLRFTNDGLALQSTELTDGQTLVVLSTDVSSASMLDSGNFVLYNSNGGIVWQSFENPTDTLLPKQRLSAGQELLSSKSKTDHSTGIFRLAMQHDGNLVQYPVDVVTPQTAYYASGTYTSGDNVSLNFDIDGHLYLRNATGSIIKNITEGGLPTAESGKMIHLMRIDVDGVFRLYSHNLKQNGNWSIVWSSVNDNCDPTGLCGFNSYCSTIDLVAVCKCLPGFEPVKQGNRTSGCERNFVADVCKYKNENFTYTMQEVDHTIFENDQYMALKIPDKEGCGKACLEDCNCEAALFDNGNCQKQRLPLRFGRRQASISGTALTKVGSTSTKPFKNTVIQNEKGSKKKGRIYILIIGVSFTTFGSILLVISVIVLWKQNVWAYRKMSALRNGDLEWNEDVAPRPYSYEEIEKMTNDFKEEIGRGASGTVYKGVMLNNSQKLVAVKRLDKVAAEGQKEFQTEMKVIGRTHHRNLVRLLGYCVDGPKRLLVYEYMINGSLADILFTPQSQPCWEERMGIARNIARGFLYLHEECDTQIIHCDIKPQNILMDEYMYPKIADFGLAKLLKPDQTRTSTGIRGTKGYVAPEWHRKMAITVKADVYSFGIVLLEIICCRRNVDWSVAEEEAILEEWAYHCFEIGELAKLVGTDEEETIDRRQLERMIKVGLWCIQDNPSLRPSMKKVLLMLEGTVDIPIPPSPNSFLSAI